jgi:ribonuclease HI
MSNLTIYTDGACSGNPGPGGYAAVIIDSKGTEVSVSGGEKNTTNNRMEMLAVIHALKYVRALTNYKDIQIQFFIDSQYVLKGITEWIEGWKRKNWKSTTGLVKNRELWEEIDALRQGVNIKWTWVKGHNEDKYNEIADELARSEIAKL